MEFHEIRYFNTPIYVPQDIYDFLEQDRRRAAAEKKRIERHIQYCDFDKIIGLSGYSNAEDIPDAVINTIQIVALRITLRTLSDDERSLLYLRFWQEETMEYIGTIFGISKMAVSKRLKKLLAKLRTHLENNFKEIF